MDATYWHKQSATAPLYSDLIWSRPENRAQAGKLLILSGSAAGFSVAGQAYGAAQDAGVVRVVLPELLRRTVPKELRRARWRAGQRRKAGDGRGTGEGGGQGAGGAGAGRGGGRTDGQKD